jgi:hypothetical protein
LFGLLLPPLAWAVQLYLNFGLASHACFPGEAPRTSFVSGWDQIWIVLVTVNVACATICAIGLLASGYSWRGLRNLPPIPASQPARTSDDRRTSFAVSGLMVSGVFTAAILFNTIFLWALSTCSQA